MITLELSSRILKILVSFRLREQEVPQAKICLRGRHGPVIYCEPNHCSQVSAENFYSNRKYLHDSAYVDNCAE